MFERFNLKLDEKTIEKDFYVNSGSITNFRKNIEEGKTIFFEKVKLKFQSETILSGTNITNEWFPQSQWDVFISHSHADEKLAIHLAAWLNRKFGLNVFIDSFVWGSADELLKLIDNEYCVLNQNKNKTTYDYEKRNYSTSHVHMMLSGALSDAIYNTECIIFLNTPNSLSVNDIELKKTSSPWIYNEIKTSSVIARKYPRKEIAYKRVLEHHDKFYSSILKDLEVHYNVTNQLSKFLNLSSEDLLEWERLNNSDVHPLDCLYFRVMNK